MTVRFAPRLVPTRLSATAQALHLQISPATGIITGTFTIPTTGKVRTVRGVLFEKTGTGAGYVSGKSETGDLLLHGLPIPGA
jgi:phage tail tape-measure protein